MQAGTAINLGGPYDYSVFWEYLNGGSGVGPQFVDGFPVHPGDDIHVYVGYDQSSGEADFYVADNTTGQWGPTGTVGKMSSYFDGSTAEWIVESTQQGGRTNGGNFYAWPLADFGHASWWDTQAEVTSNGDWKDLGDGEYTPIEEYYNTTVSPPYGLMAEPRGVGLDATSFTDYFENCWAP